MHLETTEKF